MERFSCGKPPRFWICAGGLRPASPTTGIRAGPNTPWTLVRQRVSGLAFAYEDLPDHDVIRRDSVLALACGRSDLTGAKRARARDREYALAGSSTLNRLEVGSPETARDHRYRKVAADEAKLDAALVDAASCGTPPTRPPSPRAAESSALPDQSR